MLENIYCDLETPYEEDSQDDEDFLDVCDVDFDGVVTIQDFEKLAIKYLAGESI